MRHKKVIQAAYGHVSPGRCCSVSPALSSKKVGLPMHYFDGKIILTILLMAAVTYCRLLPCYSYQEKTACCHRNLAFLYTGCGSGRPAGTFSFYYRGKVYLRPSTNIYFWAAIPSFTVALLTKNMFFTVLAGIASASLLRFIL